MELKMRTALTCKIPNLEEFWLDATEGVIESLYEGEIQGRQTKESVEHIFSRSGTTMCFSNAIVAEEGGAVVGGLHAYCEAEEASDPSDPLIDEDRFGVVKPFSELQATVSYYILSVALYPDARNRGIATQLLQQAESEAKSLGCGQLSLHVFEQNVACSLHRRLGYEEEARRPVVAHPRIRYDGDLLLMTKSL